MSAAKRVEHVFRLPEAKEVYHILPQMQGGFPEEGEDQVQGQQVNHGPIKKTSGCRMRIRGIFVRPARATT